MRKFICFLLACLVIASFASLASAKVFAYNFPKAPAAWGSPVSFNNLSPGFFQVMFVDTKGVIRIATYGVEGGAMDELTSPQLVMVFTFDKADKTASVFEGSEE